MLTIISNYLVRVAALLSAFCIIYGNSEGNSIIYLIEIVMIGMWLQMDYQKITNLLKMKKNK